MKKQLEWLLFFRGENVFNVLLNGQRRLSNDIEGVKGNRIMSLPSFKDTVKVVFETDQGVM